LYTYWSSLFVEPKKVVRQIEAICKNFLWSQCHDYQKTPFIAYDFICKPKAKARLGIKDFSLWNTVIVAKYVWFIVANKNYL